MPLLKLSLTKNLNNVFYLAFLLDVLYKESKKRYFIFKSLFISLIYLLTTLVLINYKSYLSFVFSDYELYAKIKIVLILLAGSFQAIEPLDIILLLITTLLFGLNLELVLRKIKFLSSRGGLHVTFGAGFITLAATGCASCGLSIASIVGLSAVLAALPFRGMELYVLSIIVLIASLIYNLHTLVKVCKIR